MSDGIFSALSGAVAQQRSLDIVANNVANANTTGFRADRVAFEEQLVRAANESQGPEDLRYVGVAQIQIDESAGALQQTGNPLHLAIEGDGWFTLGGPDGERFTRAGNFTTDAEGLLMSHDGLPVLGVGEDPEARRIQIPPGTAQLDVRNDGRVLADGAEVGQLDLRRFDAGALQKEGSTRMIADGDGEAAEVRVLQGTLEGSNLNAVAGLNELIQATRAFEAFQRVIRGYKTIDERAARDLGR